MFDNEVLVQAHLEERQQVVKTALRQQKLSRELAAAQRQRKNAYRVRYWMGGVLIGAGRYLQSKRTWGSVAHG